MSTELIGDIRVASYTGLLFQLVNTKPSKRNWNKAKREASKYVREQSEDKLRNIFLSVVMPCGEYINLATPSDIMNLPIKDMPCPCGDKSHWLVRFVVVNDEQVIR